jgi:SARP family transcriptional regulator, regulator of embCAB operon
MGESRTSNDGHEAPSFLDETAAPAKLPPIRVKAFGSIRVEGRGVTLFARDFGGVKTKQIFELLVLARPNPILKSRLAKELWPGEQPQNAISTLETYISVLRRKLGGEGPKARQLIVTEPEAYRLADDAFEVDIDQFAALLVTVTDQSDPEALHSIEQALLLVVGDLFADESYSKWVQDERDRLRRRVLDARLDAATIALRLGDYRAARTHAHDARERARLDERAVRLTMLAEYALGESSPALEVFNECRRSLAAELGIEPASATRELHDQIVRREPVAALLSRTDRLEAERVADAPTRSEVLVDSVAFHTLLTACTLAKVSTGSNGLHQLLEEASRLNRALAHDADAMRSLRELAKVNGVSAVLDHLLSDGTSSLNASKENGLSPPSRQDGSADAG